MENEIQVVKVEIEVGKESKEVADAIAELVKDVKAGKDVSLIAAENLAGIAQAIEGYQKIGPEQKHDSRHATRGYLGMKVSEALDA